GEAIPSRLVDDVDDATGHGGREHGQLHRDDHRLADLDRSCAGCDPRARSEVSPPLPQALNGSIEAPRVLAEVHRVAVDAVAARHRTARRTYLVIRVGARPCRLRDRGEAVVAHSPEEDWHRVDRTPSITTPRPNCGSALADRAFRALLIGPTGARRACARGAVLARTAPPSGCRSKRSFWRARDRHFGDAASS